MDGLDKQATVVIEACGAGTRPLSQLLRMAVMAGVESAVQIHIQRGDDLNARDISGMTPLMLSAARNKSAICKMLLNAGADPKLLSPSGQTALEIAVAAGSKDTAAILEAVRPPAPTLSKSETDFGLEPVMEPTSAEALRGPQVTSDTAPQTFTEPEGSAAATLKEQSLLSATAIELDDTGEELDLSSWEAEEEPTRPEADLLVMEMASAIQQALSLHEPIDYSADWDDADIYLPDVAIPLARSDDVEGRAQLRRLLLRAIREGSVPSLDVQALSANEDGSANPEAESYLGMVINDLGAELDDRFEYTDATESFEVFINPEETPDEETTLDEALSAIDRAASPRHVPLWVYQREFQRFRLLTAEEEIQLAQAMEASLDAALDALATWPLGIFRTLAAGADAIAGSRQLSSIWVGGGESDLESPSTGSLDAVALATEESEGAMDGDEEQANTAQAGAGHTTFADALRQLAELVQGYEFPGSLPNDIRQALAALHMNRRFLLELIDAADGSAPSICFLSAMTDFRKARDSMAAANLKLAFFHAKKYLYSGEPLDDLAQEGNIGLLKAVDRYDWRRGFRFSTYATWWIRQQISRYVADKTRTIRVPVHIHEKLQRMERMKQAFELATGREPTIEELAERMRTPPHKLAGLLLSTPEPSCLDELPVDEMIAIEVRDAYSYPDPADVIEKIQRNLSVDRLLSSLSVKDRQEEQILRLRFGVGVNEVLTLEEIGARFEVTRERIRQIEAKAIKKLRTSVSDCI